MSLTGTIQNGVVVFDRGLSLPEEGARVEVVVQNAATKTPKLRDRLAKLAGTVDDLPSDMARNHDHYIHGSPKK